MHHNNIPETKPQITLHYIDHCKGKATSQEKQSVYYCAEVVHSGPAGQTTCSFTTKFAIGHDRVLLCSVLETVDGNVWIKRDFYVHCKLSNLSTFKA